MKQDGFRRPGMDYKTAALCYYHIKVGGHFSAGALQVLQSEVAHSGNLQEHERQTILSALKEVSGNNRFGDSPSAKQLWNALAAHQEFQRAWGEVLAEVSPDDSKGPRGKVRRQGNP